MAVTLLFDNNLGKQPVMPSKILILLFKFGFEYKRHDLCATRNTIFPGRPGSWTGIVNAGTAS